jgi:hypothetical protein
MERPGNYPGVFEAEPHPAAYSPDCDPLMKQSVPLHAGHAQFLNVSNIDHMQLTVLL